MQTADPCAVPAAAIVEARQDLAFWRREILAETATPYQFDFNNRRLATARRRVADIEAWLRPPGLDGRTPPPGLDGAALALALAYLARLRTPENADSPAPLRVRLTPGHPAAIGAEGAGLAAAAFLIRVAPGDRHGDQTGQAARLSYAPSQPPGQRALAWAVGYGVQMSEHSKT